MTNSTRQKIPGIKVHQWSAEWDKVAWEPESRQAEPAKRHFFLFSVEARLLKRLSGIQRRSTRDHARRSDDLGIQRFHDVARSKEIADYVRYGYPWSEMSKAKRESGQFDRLRKPGWLPTGIIVNVLAAGRNRQESVLSPTDSIEIKESGDALAEMILPQGAHESSWEPSGLHPIEVIDGQHRLWAFDENTPARYELPVIAFYDLDISWQAYLFWSINITPKRINRSLAFDLYPLLRTEDWLDESLSAHIVYRETRAQELVEALYAHPLSPWHRRINMLGETRAQSGDARPMVSQNAWINSLLATLVKPWDSRRTGVGGLFGSQVGEAKSVLQWTRAQQSAFLIVAWQALRDAIGLADEPWIKELRRAIIVGAAPDDDADPFVGKYSLLTTDQGVRGYLACINDLCFVLSDELVLDRWRMSDVTPAYDEGAVSQALNAINRQPVAAFLREVASAVARFDWRTSAAPGLADDVRRTKSAFRGGSGYRVLREDLIGRLAQAPGRVGKAAKQLLEQTDSE